MDTPAAIAILQAEEPARKWKIGYAAYNEVIKNGTTTVVVDGEDDAPGQNALPPRPRGHKSTKADLARSRSLKTPWLSGMRRTAGRRRPLLPSTFNAPKRPYRCKGQPDHARRLEHHGCQPTFLVREEASRDLPTGHLIARSLSRQHYGLLVPLLLIMDLLCTFCNNAHCVMDYIGRNLWH
jgi:hypothetical protein